MNKRLLLIVLIILIALPVLAQDDEDAEEDEPICLEFLDSSVDVRTGYYMGEGAAFISSAEYFRAIESFTCVIDEIDDTYVDAYINRAAALVARRDYESAIEDFTRIIELDPDSIPAFNNRAIVHAAMQEYELALEDFNTVLDLDSDYVLGYSNRAVIKSVMGDFEAAIADLEQAIENSGIDDVYEALIDPEIEDPEEYDWRAAQPYALLGIVYSEWALDNYETYLRLAGSRGDRRIQGAAGALESRLTFELRLDDGTWLFTMSFD